MFRFIVFLSKIIVPCPGPAIISELDYLGFFLSTLLSKSTFYQAIVNLFSFLKMKCLYLIEMTYQQQAMLYRVLQVL